MQLPIRTRLTLVFAILVAIVLLGTGAFVHLRFRQDLRTTSDAGLLSRAQALLAGIDDQGVQFGDEGKLIDADEAFAQVVGPNGELIESTPALEGGSLLPQSSLARLGRSAYFDVPVTASEETFDARILAVRSEEGPVAIVGVSLEQQTEAASRLANGLLLGGLAALGITTLIGWLVAGAVLRPVERMRAEAAQISADKPGRRLQVSETGDELARLGETLNAMLARLEQTIERERRFVDDASHELRTPLGILKTELELALRKARTPEELESALRSAAEESDRLNSLAEDLLVLARSDRGRLPVRREDTDVSRLIRGTVDGFQTLADSRGVQLQFQASEGRARVDPDRLRQALGNLIDNSIRHSPRGSTVTIRGWVEGTDLHLEVADKGRGFPAEFLSRAFDAFARSDDGRARRDGGAGLGLAIVLAIAEAHGGSATVNNQVEGGAIVTMVMPQ